MKKILFGVIILFFTFGNSYAWMPNNDYKTEKEYEKFIKTNLKELENKKILTDDEKNIYVWYKKELEIIQQDITKEDLKLQKKSVKIDNKWKLEYAEEAFIWESNSQVSLASTSWYNRTWAVSYAYNWVGKRNSNYNFYYWMNNCTNFISQVLEAGYVSYIIDGALWKYDNKNWYYVNTSNAAPSWTWGWANNLKNHMAYQSGRYSLVSSYSSLSVWDIIQADWTNDWSVDHSMVITKKTSNSASGIYLTYSNDYNNTASDKKDIKLSDIQNAYSGESYYFWHVIY